MGARGLAPCAHRVRVLAGEFFHCERRAAVGVAFAQHRVHGAAQHLRVAAADRFFGIGLRALRKVGNLESAALQLLDRADQLVLRGADVGQLDDVGVGLQRQSAELGQVVGALLRVGQVVAELAQHTCCDRDVGLDDLDAGRRREGANDGQKGEGRQHRRLVGERVDDRRLGGRHGRFSVGELPRVSDRTGDNPAEVFRRGRLRPLLRQQSASTRPARGAANQPCSRLCRGTLASRNSIWSARMRRPRRIMSSCRLGT